MARELCLSGRDHVLNNVAVIPISIIERNKMAAMMVMNLHNRGIEDFPPINHNWSFGDTMFILWSYKKRIEKYGIEPTADLLLEMLFGMQNEHGLPFGFEPEFKQIEFEFDASKIEPAPQDLGVFEKDGRVWVSSLAIAKTFKKSHKNVIPAIENFGTDDDFGRVNFQPIFYTDKQNRKQPAYNLTKVGCTVIVVGFTGDEAKAFKKAYVMKFEEMEAELRARDTQKAPALPSPKKETAPTPKPRRKGKNYYWPEEAAPELGLVGYRVLYKRLEALGLLKHTQRRRYEPLPEYENYVKMRTLRTKNGHSYQRPVITLAGMDYLREKLD